MKYFVVFALIAVAVAQDTTFTSKFDHIDAEEVVKSDRLFKGYFNCLLEMGPCTPDGTELKKRLPEALENNCAACTDKQREGRARIIEYLTKERPEEWAALKAKFDPDNKYTEKYSAQAQAAGVTL